MYGEPETKAVEPTVSQRDIDYINERISKINKKISFILAVMIDKGMIGENVAKSIEESKPLDDGLIDWLMEEIKKV